MEENDCQRFRRVPLRVCRTAVKKDRANLRILKDSEAVCSSPYRVRPFHGQRMDLCYQYLFQHPGRYRLVKEEQMAYWQYIGGTRLHPENQIPSWKVVWNFLEASNSVLPRRCSYRQRNFKIDSFLFLPQIKLFWLFWVLCIFIWNINTSFSVSSKFLLRFCSELYLIC